MHKTVAQERRQQTNATEQRIQLTEWKKYFEKIFLSKRRKRKSIDEKNFSELSSEEEKKKHFHTYK
jgi:hypothetical protein